MQKYEDVSKTLIGQGHRHGHENVDPLSILQARQDIDQPTKQRIRYWLEANFDEETKRGVSELLKHDQKGIIDAFYTTLDFGTGGLRGIMGPGSNRMNIYTVRSASQGLANYLKKSTPQELRVVIGYDSRHRSSSFAEESARVLAASGIHVLLFPKLCPTPLVSFACRYYNCQAGIMITASHNPSSYNGYKVYWNDGSQVLAPHDKGIINEVRRLHTLDLISLAELSDPLITSAGNDVEEAYLKAIATEQLWPNEKKKSDLKILYSNLHGTGIKMVPRALECYGFTNIGFVEEQKEPDGNFPTTDRPNPEEKEALQLGIDKLMEGEYDIFIATDPDADRVGIVVRHKGKPVILTGNQIACIAAEYICRARIENRQMPKNGAFVKSIVTTELFGHIARAHGADCFDVLTGFKFIAEKIRQWESTGEFQYIFGAEESYGYLLGSHTHDKDAIIATCIMCEIANHAKNSGKTLIDFLEDIYQLYGVYREDLATLDFNEGKEGKARMEKIMQCFREKPPTSLADCAVIETRDLSTMLILELEDQSKIVIRPSGTEPKMKIYIMVKENSSNNTVELISQADQKLAFLKNDILKQIKNLLEN